MLPNPKAARNDLLVEKIVDNIRPMNGSEVIITHLMLHEWLQEPDRRKIYPLVSRAKRILMREDHLFLQTIKGLGYQIAKPGDEIHQCADLFLNGKKRMVRAVIWSNMIQLDRQTEGQRSQTIMEQQKMANLLALMGVPALERQTTITIAA